MHKAKGLSARAVIAMACEDEYVPGRQQAIGEDEDERRLLYVSLTRAREALFITYAQYRHGQQQFTGRDSGKRRRSLTRFLRNAPLHPKLAADYFKGLVG
jgi:DNA helicase-2/ATP-dependent DNA helicase PcrA